MIRVSLEDYQKAITDFTEAIRSAPNDADAYYSRGIVCGRLKDYQGSIKDLEKANQLGNPRAVILLKKLRNLINNY